MWLEAKYICPGLLDMALSLEDVLPSSKWCPEAPLGKLDFLGSCVNRIVSEAL